MDASQRARLARAVCLVVALSGCAAAPQRPTPVVSALPPACDQAWPTRAPHFVATPYDAGLPQRGQWRDGFDLADMDGDGVLDLLHGAPRKGQRTPMIFLGDGRGAFRYWREAHFPPLPYDYGDAKAADFNRDGLMDIALGVHLHGLVALVHEGGGHYAPWGEGLTLRAPADSSGEQVFSSRSLALGDFNGDERPDLLALNEGPALLAPERQAPQTLLLRFNRDRFWEPLPVAPNVSAFGDALAVGDVDRDGRSDALFGTLRDGERRLLLLGKQVQKARELRSLPAETAVTAVTLQDLDRDGRDEAILATRTREPDKKRYCTALMQLSLDRHERESAAWFWSEVSLDNVVALAAGDIDRDRRIDVVALRRDGGLQFFSGTRGGPVADLSLPVPSWLRGCQAYELRLADLDGDAQLELIANYAGDDPGEEGTDCPSQGGFQAWRVSGG